MVWSCPNSFFLTCLELLLVGSMGTMVANHAVRRRHAEQRENQEVLRRRVHHVPRVWVDRSNPLEAMSAEVIKENYCFCKETLRDITHEIHRILQRATQRSCSLPVLLQVMVALRFFATGGYYHLVGRSEKVSKSSVCKCVHTVAAALVQLTPRFVKLPSTAELPAVKDAFEKKGRAGRWGGIPGIVGAVDGTLIHIKRPGDNTLDYICQKGFPAINVQCICGPDNVIYQSSCRWPGSMGNSRMFTASSAVQLFEDGEYSLQLKG